VAKYRATCRERFASAARFWCMTIELVQVPDEITGLRQELKDLEEALVRRNPPLAPHTRDIAKAKIAKLLRQIKELEGSETARS
jgi:hypothetical protein